MSKAQDLLKKMETKKVSEKYKDYKLDFRAVSNAKLINDLIERSWDISSNGIMIDDARDQGYPIPWDAGIEVKGKDLILSGSAGSNGFGSCEVKIPLKNSDAYQFSIEGDDRNNDFVDYIDQLRNAGVKVS